ncbi:MAG TPA: efflux RND transporter periplasmic adaptor subunit [Steroidobacteraceae bacterium]|nr:efflux RND transporter periplasmic adaptor subunit [Steroidobacteraceae bacterium]
MVPGHTRSDDVDHLLGVTPRGSLARHRKWLGAGAALIALSIAAALVFGSRGEGPVYATAEIVRGDLQVRISATGNLAPTNEVEVGSELSGLVEAVLVDVNDRVTQGQPIARLDTLRLRDSLERSKAALLAAQAGVAQADASERQSRATLARFEEVHRLSDGKVPSATELDAARADHDRAVADQKAARAQVASAEAQVSSDRVNLEKATIRSPVTGVVLSRQVDPGQTVAASFNTPTLFRIAEDLASMKLEVKVDEADVGQVAMGQHAVFTVDAFPEREFPAVIQRVDLGANSATGTSTTSSSTGSSSVVAYTAVLAVENRDLTLRPGMTATAEIVTQTVNDALLVPNAALRYKPRTDAGQGKGALTMMGTPPGRLLPQRTKSAKVSRGSQQTLYVLGAGGELTPVLVTVGATDGTLTSVGGPGVEAGRKVVTGELAQPT